MKKVPDTFFPRRRAIMVCMSDAHARPRRWFRFSMRSLLLLVALLAVPLAWKVNRVHHQRAVVAEVMSNGGMISYSDDPYSLRLRGVVRASTPNLSWWRSWLGDDYFVDVVGVILTGSTVGDATLARIATLPNLERLDIYSNKITDDGLKPLASHRKLKELTLSSPHVTDKGLRHLTGLTALEELSIGLNLVGETQLDQIAILRQVTSLNIDGMQSLVGPYGIADDELEQISKLDNLRRLHLSGSSITDAGLAHLHRMKNLESVSIHRTDASIDGISSLHKALPRCKKFSWNP